ncbi:MAG TPA: carbamoyltransferase C-terminal domain-containing protein [Thermoanaerobaculia bacterium]|nr:carbamoyltransferase C-terminal domain-containing protein [Thermoanaerobaculia bacterium]
MHDHRGRRQLRRLHAPRFVTGLRNGFRPPRRFRNVLGIACTGHGASLALVTEEGTVRASVLDRWSGKKHALLLARQEAQDILHPRSKIDKAIHFLLTCGREMPPVLIFEDVISDWTTWLLRGTGLALEDIDLIVNSESYFATCRRRLGGKLHRWFPNAWVAAGIEHHEVHQRQAFWQSGFDEAAVLTLDACGEPLDRLGKRSLAGTITRMDATGRAETMAQLFFPESSPGLIYDVVNRHAGFQLGDEGKTMGLAPYGRRDALLDSLQPQLRLHPDGHFDFIPHRQLEERLREYVPQRGRGDAMTPRHENVAYAGQALLEQIVENAFAAALRVTGQRKLAYAGGVALNSVANELAFRATRPDALYIAPNGGDTGHALGAALFGAYEIAGFAPPLREVPDALGPEYSLHELREAAQASGAFVSEPADAAEELARAIAAGCITARFDGRAEYGPRALGNRSILCDPRAAEMKDHLNARVKFREGFRPFAPAVLEENASEYFDIEGRSAYMLRVVPARASRQDRIAATVHVDGSCRVQTVSRDDNAGFYDVIRAFERITDVPVVLNTSFNIAGKPIVETPLDAVRCFNETAIDVLALGPFMLTKTPAAAWRDATPSARSGAPSPVPSR